MYMNSVLFIIPVLLVRAPTAVWATNELVPFGDKSAAYNAGFSQGFLGTPFKGHHTQDFIYGYKNGTRSYQFNLGSVMAYNGLRVHLITMIILKVIRVD